MVKCEICKREFKNLKSISIHIRVHNIKAKDYYDKYLKIEDNICLNYGKVNGCKKYTNFKNIVTGYHEYCSTKCLSNAPHIRKHRSECRLGDKHWLRQPGAKHFAKDKTYIEQFGIEKAAKLKSNLSSIGKDLKGNKNPFYGKTHSKETKNILKQHKIGKSYIDMYGLEKAKIICMKQSLSHIKISEKSNCCK